MRTKNIIYLLLSCTLFICSCKKEEEVEIQKSSENIIIPRVQSLPIQENVATPAQTAVAPTQPQSVPNPAQMVTQNPVSGKGLNPAHGQVGHRCDIAVGAPLNSPIKKAPASTGKPATITQATTSNPTTPAILSTSSTIPVVTAPGMNPPHGQEGHKCNIAVGAPLPK